MHQSHTHSHTQPPRVAVVGGGLAGLAAAYYLARSGRCEVTVFERKKHMGGRTFSFAIQGAGTDAGDVPALPTGPVWLDNSIHIAMGCCTALVQFLKDIGAGQALQFHNELAFVDAAGRREKLRLNSRWNRLHPLGQMEGILRAKFLTRSERLAIVGLFSSLAQMSVGAQRHLTGTTFAAYGRQLNLPPGVVAKFLEPLLIGALNTPYERCDFGLARTFFTTGLLRNPQSGWMGVFRGDLQSALIDPAVAALQDAGVIVKPVQALRQIQLLPPVKSRRGGRTRTHRQVELLLTGGHSWRGEAAILAIPWFEPVLTELLPLAGRLAPSPIVCLHLGYDRAVMAEPCLGLLESPLHWLFARDLSVAEGGGQLISAVVSCSTALEGVANKTLIAEADAEIRRRLPEAAAARLRFARCVKNNPATFLSDPACTGLRPPPGAVPGHPGVYIAGEWTATGWPSTMEGAVRSAIMALRQVVPDLGLHADTLPAIAELPRAGLMKLLLQP